MPLFFFDSGVWNLKPPNVMFDRADDFVSEMGYQSVRPWADFGTRGGRSIG